MMIRWVLPIAAVAISQAAMADDYCSEAIGECEAAVEIYDAADDNPILDFLDDRDDGSGSSMDEDFESAVESQDDYTGAEVPDNDFFD